MSHSFHQGLDGFDERQILHDGCPECEERGEDVAKAIGYLDDERFERAWRRAFHWKASSGGGHATTGPISYAETDMLEALWAVQVQLERRGHPLGQLPPNPMDEDP